MHAIRRISVTLSAAEQRDFDLIVRSARESGWLDEACSITAVPLERRVLITSVCCDQISAHSYEWSSRWLYQFLHDLAHGQWRSRTRKPELI